VSTFKDELAVRGAENILNFASRGQARLRIPTLFLHNASPATIKALAHWLSNPQVSMLFDGEFRRMRLFDFTEQRNNSCGCGRVELRVSGTLSLGTYCSEHVPNAAISMICFAKEFHMAKLQHENTKGLLISCGIDQFVQEHVGFAQFPHRITLESQN
jgi:hypothetical protein